MSATGRTLVLGTAVGYDVAKVWVFVESLRRHYFGDAMLLITRRAPARLLAYLEMHGIQPAYFDTAEWMLPHVQFGRFVRYGEILRMSAVRYDHILLTDVGDVVFQAHPFADLPAGELLTFTEAAGRTIAQCEANSRWVLDIFGPEMLMRIGGAEISCSGTTIGTQAAILDYIELLVDQPRPDQFIKLVGLRGHDQGIHNALLHTGNLPAAVKVPNGRHVFTLGFIPDAQVDVSGGAVRLSASDHLPAIVHQYNYNKVADGFVRAAFPIPTGA